MRTRALAVTTLHVARVYLLARQKAPFLASFKLTYRCNLTCQQCPFHQMQSADPDFTAVVRTLDALKERGNRVVIFEGGEPMLWRDGERRVHAVVEEANRRFAVTGMTTNGTLSLDAPVSVLWVSVDGFRETHNALRGGEIFDRVMENIARSAHPCIYAHITVNNRNAGEVPALIPYLSERVPGITLQFYYPYGKKDELFLDFGRRAELIERVIELKREGYPVLNSVAALRALEDNHWRCADWLIDNANPDGSLSQGCYLRGRDDIDCARCGFSPHTEASLAYQGRIEAILAGLRIFFL